MKTAWRVGYGPPPDERPLADVQDNTIVMRQLAWLPAEATALLLDRSDEDQALVDAWTQVDTAKVQWRSGDLPQAPP